MNLSTKLAESSLNGFYLAVITDRKLKPTELRGVSLQLSSHNNSNNQSIDGHSLAEDDRDQILGLNPGSLDTTADDRDTGGVDAESSADNGKGHGKANSDGGPHVGAGLHQEPSKTYGILK